MEAVLEFEVSQRNTGIGMYDWLRQTLTESSFQTDQPHPANLVYIGPTFRAESSHVSFYDESESFTDASMDSVFMGHEISGMVRNLSELSSVAALVIPGLREMTSAEHRNLRQYYSQLFRKL